MPHNAEIFLMFDFESRDLTMLFLSVINAIRWPNIFDEMAFGIDF